MPEQHLTPMLQQKRDQIETSRKEQLSSLIQQLECKKKLLPIEDHLVIDWGIGVLRARIREEEEFMNKLDEQWNRILRENSLLPSLQSENIDLSNWEDRKRVCDLGQKYLDEIVDLVLSDELTGKKEVLRYNQFETAIRHLKQALCLFCKPRYAEFYAELRQLYREHLIVRRLSSQRSLPYCEPIIKVFDQPWP